MKNTTRLPLYVKCAVDNVPIRAYHQPGIWHSGSASALHAESPGFDPPYLQHAIFEWSRVRLTLGANCGTYSSVVERSIAEHFFAYCNCVR